MGDGERSRRVLVVDDDEMVREFIAHCLEQAGFRVMAAASGEEALRLFLQNCDEIDLVVTDMVMPGLFGDQLAVRLWEQNNTLPILFVSGNPPESLEPGVTLEPGWNFLRKPFAVSELLDAIQRLFRILISVTPEDNKSFGIRAPR